MSKVIASALGAAVIELGQGQTMAVADSVSFPDALKYGYLEFYLGNVEESNLSNGDYSDWDHPEDYQKNIRYGSRVVIFQNGKVHKHIQDVKFSQLVCISTNLLPAAKNS